MPDERVAAEQMAEYQALADKNPHDGTDAAAALVALPCLIRELRQCQRERDEAQNYCGEIYVELQRFKHVDCGKTRPELSAEAELAGLVCKDRQVAG